MPRPAIGARPRRGAILCFLLLAGGSSLPAQGVGLRVEHAPREPRSGEAVRVTVRAEKLLPARAPTLQYQIVEPGGYVALQDAAYQKNWSSLPMEAAAGSYCAELPPSIQKHRRLIRYRIALDGRSIAPAPDDPQPNFAYFVHDGLPAWKGAIHPTSRDPARSQPRTFDSRLLSSLQCYQLLAAKEAVENTTWYRPASFGDEAQRHQYTCTGTLVAGGEVYDHVRFRARGGQWRHAMGKNMWKIEFLPGHPLRPRDDLGRPYAQPWTKLNLGACIQQGDYQRRGEHGLFEAVTFRLFNLAGVPAPRTHYVHLRIVDGPEEAPDQYHGDFWGLYLAVEEVDGAFLREHGLNDGNIYKLDFGQPKPEHLAGGAAKTPGLPEEAADVHRFVERYQSGPPDAWWIENVELERYYRYRSIIECVHHYDISSGKNYFYYHDLTRGRWTVLPWDVDLTWADHMYGEGAEPFLTSGLLERPSFSIAYRNRLRAIRDLLFNPEEAGAVIDECAAVIADPAGGPSFVDADRAHWDFNPILQSRWVVPGKAGVGLYYRSSPTRDFAGMVKLMKDYVAARGAWCDAQLLSDRETPPIPRLAAEGPLDASRPSLRLRASVPAGGKAIDRFEWRLARISLGPVTRPLVPRYHEIEPLWEETGPALMEIPARDLAPGGTYRIRARARDAAGRCGHWSAPIELPPR